MLVDARGGERVADDRPPEHVRLVVDAAVGGRRTTRREEHLPHARRQDGTRAAGEHRAGSLGLGLRLRRRRVGGGEPADLLLEQWAAEIRHRPAGLEERLLVAMHRVHQEPALLEPREQPVEPRAVKRAAGRGGRPFEAVEHAGLVAGGLEPAQEPEAGVGEPLVVEVDGVLRGQHHAQAVGPGLLHEREDRRLARRVGDRRHVAEHLVHQEQRLERGGAPL